MTMTVAQGQPSDSPVTPYRGASAPNIIGYRFTNLDPASNIYVQRDDKLVIQALSVITGEVLNVNIRLLQPGRPTGRTQPDSSTADNPLGDSPFGVIVPINVQVAAPTVNTSFSKTIDLAEGYLMSVAVSSTQSGGRGQTFARAFILRGSASVTNCSYLLCSDYVTTLTAIGWPYGVVRSPLDGPGILQGVGVTNPAAGTDWTLTLAAPFRGLIRSIQGTLITSAAAANRLVTARLNVPSFATDAGTYPANQVIPASTTAKVTFSPGVPGNALNPTIVNVQLPQPISLQCSTLLTEQLSITTINLQAGDQWQGVTCVVEEWMDL